MERTKRWLWLWRQMWRGVVDGWIFERFVGGVTSLVFCSGWS